LDEAKLQVAKTLLATTKNYRDMKQFYDNYESSGVTKEQKERTINDLVTSLGWDLCRWEDITLYGGKDDKIKVNQIKGAMDSNLGKFMTLPMMTFDQRVDEARAMGNNWPSLSPAEAIHEYHPWRSFTSVHEGSEVIESTDRIDVVPRVMLRSHTTLQRIEQIYQSQLWMTDAAAALDEEEFDIVDLGEEEYHDDTWFVTPNSKKMKVGGKAKGPGADYLRVLMEPMTRTEFRKIVEPWNINFVDDVPFVVNKENQKWLYELISEQSWVTEFLVYGCRNEYYRRIVTEMKRLPVVLDSAMTTKLALPIHGIKMARDMYGNMCPNEKDGSEVTLNVDAIIKKPQGRVKVDSYNIDYMRKLGEEKALRKYSSRPPSSGHKDVYEGATISFGAQASINFLSGLFYTKKENLVNALSYLTQPGYRSRVSIVSHCLVVNLETLEFAKTTTEISGAGFTHTILDVRGGSTVPAPENWKKILLAGAEWQPFKHRLGANNWAAAEDYIYPSRLDTAITTAALAHAVSALVYMNSRKGVAAVVIESIANSMRVNLRTKALSLTEFITEFPKIYNGPVPIPYSIVDVVDMTRAMKDGIDVRVHIGKAIFKGRWEKGMYSGDFIKMPIFIINELDKNIEDLRQLKAKLSIEANVKRPTTMTRHGTSR